MNIKNNKGYSLVEVLAAIIILLLVTGGVVTGVVLSQHQYQNSITQSEASELYNSLSSLINNELKFTNQIKTEDENVTSFYSISYATKSDLTKFAVIDSNGNDTSGYGQIILRSASNSSEIKRILSYGAYTNGLGARVDSLTYIDGIFTVTLSIGTSDKTIISKTFNVRPLNTIVINKDN